jgi:thiamine-monophosphate kinase
LSGPVRVSDLSEFRLIDRLVARLPALGRDVRVGPGDDVAAIDLGAGRWLLATTDVQVAGVHFLAETVDPRRLGRRSAAVNLSDVAAVGGRPLHFLVSLVLPPSTPVAFVDALYDGLAEECGRHGVDVIGGNVSAGPALAIDLMLLGEVGASEMLRRDGAQVGDAVLVTGELGCAAAGLILARRPELRRQVEALAARAAEDALETPEARVAEGRAIVSAGGATAAIDISDGLAADLTHVCDRSAVGVRIDAAALPVGRATREIAAAAAVDPLDLALGGGEDYELLFTAPPDRVDALVSAVRRCGTPVARIGSIVEAGAGRDVTGPGSETRPLGRSGFRHFG